MKQIISSLLVFLLAAATPLQAQNYTKVTYIHSDADGTPFAATDSQGNVEWQIKHYPYGGEYSNTEVARKSDISFAGKPYDEEIGLSYFGGRWYDPATGRFTGIDPMPVDPNDYRTFNRYAYGFNNPYKYVDPDGNLPILIPIAIWAGKALAVTGAAASGYSVGDNGYALYSGRKSVGEASKDAAIGVGTGLILKGTGAGVLKISNNLKNVEITVPYKRPSGATTPAQREFVQNKPCVDCGNITNRQIADHKTPLVKEYYETGKINVDKMKSLDAVQPQCTTCSARQGAKMSQFSKQQKNERGLK